MDAIAISSQKVHSRPYLSWETLEEEPLQFNTQGFIPSRQQRAILYNSLERIQNEASSSAKITCTITIGVQYFASLSSHSFGNEINLNTSAKSLEKLMSELVEESRKEFKERKSLRVWGEKGLGLIKNQLRRWS